MSLMSMIQGSMEEHPDSELMSMHQRDMASEDKSAMESFSAEESSSMEAYEAEPVNVMSAMAALAAMESHMDFLNKGKYAENPNTPGAIMRALEEGLPTEAPAYDPTEDLEHVASILQGIDTDDGVNPDQPQPDEGISGEDNIENILNQANDTEDPKAAGNMSGATEGLIAAIKAKFARKHKANDKIEKIEDIDCKNMGEVIAQTIAVIKKAGGPNHVNGILVYGSSGNDKNYLCAGVDISGRVTNVCMPMGNKSEIDELEKAFGDNEYTKDIMISNYGDELMTAATEGIIAKIKNRHLTPADINEKRREHLTVYKSIAELVQTIRDNKDDIHGLVNGMYVSVYRDWKDPEVSYSTERAIGRAFANAGTVHKKLCDAIADDYNSSNGAKGPTLWTKPIADGTATFAKKNASELMSAIKISNICVEIDGEFGIGVSYIFECGNLWDAGAHYALVVDDQIDPKTGNVRHEDIDYSLMGSSENLWG